MNNNLKVVMAIVSEMNRYIKQGCSKEEVNRFRWTIKQITKVTGLSTNQVITSLNELMEKGYVRSHVGKYVEFSLTNKCKEHIKRLAKREE